MSLPRGLSKDLQEKVDINWTSLLFSSVQQSLSKMTFPSAFSFKVVKENNRKDQLRGRVSQSGGVL